MLAEAVVFDSVGWNCKMISANSSTPEQSNAWKNEVAMSTSKQEYQPFYC